MRLALLDPRSRRLRSVAVALGALGCAAACSFPQVDFGSEGSAMDGSVAGSGRSSEEGGGAGSSGSRDDSVPSGSPSASMNPSNVAGTPEGGATASAVGSSGSSASSGLPANSGAPASSGSVASSGAPASSGSLPSSGSPASSGSSASSGSPASSGSSASSGTVSSGAASSDGGERLDATAGPNCNCDPSQMYPTNVQCGTVASLLNIGIGCTGPSEGFSDNPACGQKGNFVTCTGALTVLGLGTACTASPGPSTMQECR